MTVVLSAMVGPWGKYGWRSHPGNEIVGLDGARISELRVVNDVDAVARCEIVRDEENNLQIKSGEGTRLAYKDKDKIVGDLTAWHAFDSDEPWPERPIYEW